MPRKSKKQDKTREEKIAENYFPVDESNVKGAVEKAYKKPDLKSLETIEKPAKSSNKKTTRKKTTKKRETKKVEYKPPKISLKKTTG